MGDSDPYLDDDEPTYPAKPKAESGMRQKVRVGDKQETTAVTVVVEVDPEPDTEPDTPTFPR